MKGRDPGEADLKEAQSSMCQVLWTHPGKLRRHREHHPVKRSLVTCTGTGCRAQGNEVSPKAISERTGEMKRTNTNLSKGVFGCIGEKMRS